MSDSFGDWPLQRLMTEVVGSGPKSADDMTAAQATEAFERILADEPDPTTLGAFWLANRWKKNNPEELGAFLDVMRRDSVKTGVPECDPVDCGANYDGKSRSALLGVASGVVAAAAGTPVVVHSGDHVPSGMGVAYKHVLDELGVTTDLGPSESADMVDSTGFGFYYQPRFNPGVHGLFGRRERMGVRTFVNTVETLANPANADVHLGSFYHLAFATKVTDTFRASEETDVDRVLMFQGMEGYDDVRPGSTVVAEWNDGDDDLDDFTIETEEYGMDFDSEALEVADVAADSADITRDVLAGDRTDAFADAVALNAALRIYARQDADSIDDGLDMARDAIASGDAEQVLADLVTF
ncbi:anthranilate phosphoribosyltransferase [Halocalculus aciditolerans]|uniref:Anthranilate phosphoribosyltransferase n=1 Tax=Halocalculus aciditolerans TaxID=1383812 RepID=A0A830F313_9EURY|nr:anthranilate phosphoribosyltransferase [Halocalculus aciditolerans]GGL50409.1 anthranilate phosphoribosyltransferase [Halocalculus aciditolerans]